MPRSRVKKLSSFFRTAVKAAVEQPSSANSSGEDAALKHYVSSLDLSSSSSSSKISRAPKLRTSKKSSLRRKQNRDTVSDLISHSLHDGTPSSEDSAKHASQEISSILCGFPEMESDDPFSELDDDDDTVEDESESDLSWFSNLFNNSTSLRRKELSRERKNKWIFKNTQKSRFDKLFGMCHAKLGSGSTFQVLFKLGRETGLKEYSAFIRGCVETARSSKDERVQVEQIYEAYRLFQLMKERGFPIEEEAFGPFLLYLIDMRMTDQFFVFLEIIKDEDPSLHPRLGYYEMLLWIEIDNEEKIQELCNHIATAECEMGSSLHENYLLALCERDRRNELLQLFDIIDITRVSSMDNIASIFRCLGRLSLDFIAEVFILVLKDCDHGAQSISNLIYYYATSTKNLAVEDVILNFKEMHGKLNVELLPESYEKLITFCCDSRKVPLALDLVDEMCKAGLCLSTETLNSICHACEETCEYILVRRIYSVLCDHNLKPNVETLRSIINLNVRMKDFDSAYAMLNDSERLNLVPTANMYNAIMAGYYREKNMDGASRVLKEMESAGVKPDSQTFSFLITNCACEEKIVEYYEELKRAGVQPTKHVFMALINAYAVCGQFEKAKQVLLDKGIPVKNLNEIKSVLVSALALHGQISDALEIYEEIKQNGFSLEPKAVISLIEHIEDEGELSLLLNLLDELNDKYYWIDGCFRVILYCIQNKNLRSTVDLLKKLVLIQDDELAREVVFDEVFSQIADMEPLNLQMGMDLLRIVKEELKLHPSRKCLDFLLGACVRAKDLRNAQLVWKEYLMAGLPYNILSFLRMYQAFLASGHVKAADSFLRKIPKEDPHVRAVIHACRVTYGKPTNVKDKKKKKKNEN